VHKRCGNQAFFGTRAAKMVGETGLSSDVTGPSRHLRRLRSHFRVERRPSGCRNKAAGDSKTPHGAPMREQRPFLARSRPKHFRYVVYQVSVGSRSMRVAPWLEGRPCGSPVYFCHWCTHSLATKRAPTSASPRQEMYWLSFTWPIELSCPLSLRPYRNFVSEL
jgi:hypothetical protein